MQMMAIISQKIASVLSYAKKCIEIMYIKIYFQPANVIEMIRYYNSKHANIQIIKKDIMLNFL